MGKAIGGMKIAVALCIAASVILGTLAGAQPAFFLKSLALLTVLVLIDNIQAKHPNPASGSNA